MGYRDSFWDWLEDIQRILGSDGGRSQSLALHLSTAHFSIHCIHCTALHCIPQHCTVLYCTVLCHSTSQDCTAQEYCRLTGQSTLLSTAALAVVSLPSSSREQGDLWPWQLNFHIVTRPTFPNGANTLSRQRGSPSYCAAHYYNVI